MIFRVYYGDGTVFEGDRPEDAPTQNVQAIAWDDTRKEGLGIGRVVLEQYDLYIYSDHVGDWHGTNKYYDLLQHLEQGCGPGGVRAVLTGRWISYDKYKEIITKAKTDEGLRPKSAADPIREDGTE